MAPSCGGAEVRPRRRGQSSLWIARSSVCAAPRCLRINITVHQKTNEWRWHTRSARHGVCMASTRGLNMSLMVPAPRTLELGGSPSSSAARREVEVRQRFVDPAIDHRRRQARSVAHQTSPGGSRHKELPGLYEFCSAPRRPGEPPALAALPRRRSHDLFSGRPVAALFSSFGPAAGARTFRLRRPVRRAPTLRLVAHGLPAAAAA